MSKRFSSILTELDLHVPKPNRDLIVESRASQLIASFTNLMSLIEETYDPSVAADLQKRLVNALRTQDDKKFSRKIRSLSDKGDDE